MKNLEIIKKELEKATYDGHEFKIGENIVKKLSFEHINDLTNCIMEITKTKHRKTIEKKLLLMGFLQGIEYLVKKRYVGSLISSLSEEFSREWH